MWNAFWSALAKLLGNGRASSSLERAVKILEEMIDHLDARLQACEQRWEQFEKTRAWLDAQDLAHVNAIIVSGEHGIIKEWNEAATKMFGWEQAVAIGKDLTIIIPPRFRNQHLSLYRQAVKDRVIFGSKVLDVIGLHIGGFELQLTVEISSWINDNSEMRFSGEIRRRRK